MFLDTSGFHLKIADSERELSAAKRLRYQVFVDEMGANASAEQHALQQEFDVFDDVFDHLVLIDTTIGDPSKNVVAVYRLLRGEVAAAHAGFYSQTEFDLGPLLQAERRLLELGRSCVHPQYRGGAAMHHLWSGLARYVAENKVEILFGAASFAGQDPSVYAHALSFLHYNYRAPRPLRVSARKDGQTEMRLLQAHEIDRPRAMREMPPLIKAYLRLGGFVGDGAYIDRAFNTIDVCLLMDTAAMNQKYKQIYAGVRG